MSCWSVKFVPMAQKFLVASELRSVMFTVSEKALGVCVVSNMRSPTSMAHIVLGAVSWVLIVVYFLALIRVDFYTTTSTGLLDHLVRRSNMSSPIF